jgi:predicted  nucleic acid-binding Zn-ribbon protein
MHPDLEKLLELKARDVALTEAEGVVAEVAAAAAALDAALDRARRERDALGRAAAEAVRKRDESMRRVESLKTQQDRRQQRLGQVKNTKEANAVTAEIDLGRQVLVREEAVWVEQAEDVSRLEARLAEAERQLTQAEAAQAGEREHLAAKRAAAEAARAAALAEREASASRLDKPLRTRYDRLRASKSRNAVMALSGFACSACFTLVPVSRRGQIKGGLLIEGCEACGVILYQPETREVEA